MICLRSGLIYGRAIVPIQINPSDSKARWIFIITLSLSFTNLCHSLKPEEGADLVETNTGLAPLIPY